MVLPYDNMDYGVDEVGARNITELQDVELINLANEEILKYNSTSEKWENSLLVDNDTDNLADLTDTNITAPILNGSSLVYNTNTNKWQNLLLLDIDTLNNLSDTNISSLADKDFLLYDNASSKWINTPSNIDNLKNVNILSVANNEILKYNSTSSKWENSNLLINEINDVNITSLQNGEVLKYNSTSGNWENQDNTDTLNELTDVTLTGSSNNQVLKYNGSIWVNNFVNLTELADTNIPALNNGDILRYNSVSQQWETDTFNIDDLDNVNIISIANNQILKYNSTSAKWENSNETDTTYSNGTGVNLVGTTFSIGQPVATNDTVTFKNITLSRDTLSFPVEPVILYDDPLNGGTLAQIQMSGDGLSAGKLQFYTKETGAGLLTEKLTINNVGAIAIGGTDYGNTGQVLTSNGSGSSVSWGTPVILGVSLTNAAYTGLNPRTVVKYDNIEFETVTCYNTTTGVFTAPRTAYYMVNAYARVTDFVSPFGARPLSYIYKKVGGVFTLYSATDFVDENENLKVATPRTNIIINLNSGDEIRHEVTFPSNALFSYVIRGNAYEIRCSYLSIHSIG